MPTVSRSGSPGPGSPARGPESSAGHLPVYPAREDTFLLLPFAEVAPGSTFLEVGAGRGLVALAAARRGAVVVATDRNPHALRLLRDSARRERLTVRCVRTDLARGVARFDRIVANPPYLPTQPDERDPDRWQNLALDGGPDGCVTTARLVADLDDHLVPGGNAFLLTSTRQSPSRLEEIWAAWRERAGGVDRVATRPLEGERLEVYRLAARGRTDAPG
ncbi:MAG: methyltransferase [Thermoplasmata archaeon]|nr:methyltransferase [Thermoplasmata archaeon]